MATEGLRAAVMQVAALAKASTAGPWIGCAHVVGTDCPCGFAGDVWGADGSRVVCTMGTTDPDGIVPQGDCRFRSVDGQLIVAMRNLDWDALVAALTEREGAREERVDIAWHGSGEDMPAVAADCFGLVCPHGDSCRCQCATCRASNGGS